MIQRSIYLTVFLLYFIAYGNIAYAQLPLPEDFCSKAKAGTHVERAASLNYYEYDLYDVHFYHLNLWLETDNTFVKGKVDIHAQSLSNSFDTIYLELSDVFAIQQILLNDMEVDYLHTEDVLLIYSDQNIQEEEAFIIEISYQGEAVSDEGRGYMSANSYHETRVNWTLSEPFYSKDWWPCKQDLEDKADSVWVFVTTSEENKVGSNGLLTASIPIEDNKIRYEWKSKYPIAYYLISVALAKYMEYSFNSPSQNAQNVWMQNYLYADSAMYKSQKALIDCTHMQMNLLQEKYGDYPFANEKYGHCITPIGGGMEHQTMTTQRDFQFHLTIHEMGHSWFGNQVTCATWNHIWINEGFATYSQYLGLENLADRATADAFNAAMQSRVMLVPDGSVYVPDEFLDDRDRIFSGRLSYYKGSVIIQMIRYLLADDDLFFHVLQEFQSRFAYQSATAEDFRTVLEELSQEDFEEFFELWYYGEGYPIYHFDWEQSISGDLKINANQESSTPKTEFFPMKYDILFFFEDGSNSLIQVEQKDSDELFNLYFSKRVSNILPNPRSQNLMYLKSLNSGSLYPEEITIEPNPATSAFIIRFANVNLQRCLEVYNSSLQLIESLDVPNRNLYIHCDSWASGIYFLKVKNDKEESFIKLVKY